MTTLTSRLVVSLIDQVSAPARKAGAAIQGLARHANAAVAAQNRLAAGLQRQMTIAAAQARATMTRMGEQTTRATAAFAAPLALAGRFGFQAAYEFQKVGNNVQAVTQMTEEQRRSLEDYAQSLNNLFPYTNAEIMKAAFELGRAGLNFQQIMGALRGTLNLGLAGDIELQQASDIATNVMTAMGLPMKTAEEASKSLTRVNDALAYSASRSNTDVRLMGETFKYVAPIARVTGMSIEQVAAAAMVMANNGIKGSEAGVALRSMLVRMVKPTKPALAALERLNISLADFVNGLPLTPEIDNGTVIALYNGKPRVVGESRARATAADLAPKSETVWMAVRNKVASMASAIVSFMIAAFYGLVEGFEEAQRVTEPFRAALSHIHPAVWFGLAGVIALVIWRMNANVEQRVVEDYRKGKKL